MDNQSDNTEIKTSILASTCLSLIIFFSVFVISEYYKWTTNVFSENPQSYNINDPFISMLIGMTASILKDLLMEFKTKNKGSIMLTNTFETSSYYARDITVSSK